MPLACVGLAAGYDNGEQILDGIALEVEPSQVIGVIGRSGAGKTLLLRCLAGMQVPTAGFCALDGKRLGESMTPAAWHRSVAYLSQQPFDSFFNETVFDEVAYGLNQAGIDDAQVVARVRESLDLVGLDYDWSLRTSPFHLSQGEAKNVALACALSLRTEFLLLDEPTAGLDGSGSKRLQSIVESCREQGMGIVVASHDTEFLARVSSKVAVLADGRLQAFDGAPTVLSDESMLQRAAAEMPALYAIARAMGACFDASDIEALPFDVFGQKLVSTIGGIV